MIISAPNLRARRRATLLTELSIALVILFVAGLPLAFTFVQETRLCRAYYFEAVAREIVDGEMEILAAAKFRDVRHGAQPFVVTAGSATNLPPGEFTLTLTDDRARLEWRPKMKGRGAVVAREVKR